MRIRLLIALLPVLLASCAGRVNDLPPLTSTPDTAYRLGAGDTLQIIVYGENDLTGSYKVTDSGLVAMPLVGAVPAVGQSLDQFRQSLTERLRASAIRSPDVTVSVTEYRPFFILGEVKDARLVCVRSQHDRAHCGGHRWRLHIPRGGRRCFSHAHERRQGAGGARGS